MTLRLVLFAVTIGFAQPARAAIDVQLVATGVPYLIGIEHAGDGSGRLFLVSQAGRIYVYNGTTLLSTPFLDVSSLITFSGERGLLGLAFHPNYSSNGFFFIHYSDTTGNGQTVIARYHVSGNPNLADPTTATILLTENQPYTNHKGGQVSFGPDGFLYIALGDGGSGGDPHNNGQRLDTLLGKVLRIDVDSGAPYAIPPGNPFVSTSGARGEIWSYGLRNHWRFSFDRQTGDLFIADVGQGMWEEVNFQLAASPGGENYGWRRMEGLHCYEPSTGCDTGALTMPIVEYSHSLGCSVTGGFRYRGAALTSHVGTYFFADYCSGRIWGATRTGDGAWTVTQLLDTNLNITTFGQDVDGTLYLSHHAGNGQLYRLVAASASPLLTITRSGAGTGRISSSPAALDCGSVCGAHLTAGTVATLTATPDPGWSFVGWSGHPDCADGRVTLSSDRMCTATFGTSFTDNTLTGGVSVIRAVHITELRTRINGIRISRGLSPFDWTDSTLTPESTVVRTVHVTEMRAALNEAYVKANRDAPTYTDPVLAPGQFVKAVHISELRAAVVALE